MRVQMTRTRFTLVDGFSQVKLEEGKTYDLRESVACRLIRRNYAIYLGSENNATK